MDPRHFDHLVRSLSRPASRRGALGVVVGTLALLGGAAPGGAKRRHHGKAAKQGARSSAAKPSACKATKTSNSACAKFCAETFGADTPEANQCTSAATKCGGLCYRSAARLPGRRAATRCAARVACSSARMSTAPGATTSARHRASVRPVRHRRVAALPVRPVASASPRAPTRPAAPTMVAAACVTVPAAPALSAVTSSSASVLANAPRLRPQKALPTATATGVRPVRPAALARSVVATCAW